MQGAWCNNNIQCKVWLVHIYMCKTVIHELSTTASYSGLDCFTDFPPLESVVADSFTSLYLMLLCWLTSFLRQIVNYSYIEYIPVTTHLDCLRCTTKNTLIATEITSAIPATANNVAKAMITPLSSELQSQLLSLGWLLVTIKTITSLELWLCNTTLWK